MEYLKTKQEQMKKVFPLYEIVGWYSVSSGEPTLKDLEIHRQVLPFNETPLYMMLDPAPNPKQRDLPLSLYETELQLSKDGGAPALLFALSSYKVESGEAERIAVDHVAHAMPTGGAEGTKLASHLGSLHSAIKMLNIRIRTIVQFLEAEQRGQLPLDHALLRQVASLVNQLPAIDTARFRDEFINEYNDAALVSYLASLTKTASQISDLTDKYNLAFDRHSRRARFF